MHKIQSKKWVIRTSKSLNEKLKKEPRTQSEIKMWHYLKGIYDTRKFGIVIYRLNASCSF